MPDQLDLFGGGSNSDTSLPLGFKYQPAFLSEDDERDVVRHKLVQAIVKAYDSFSGGTGQRNGRRE